MVAYPSNLDDVPATAQVVASGLDASSGKQYLDVQTLGSIVRNSLTIYTRNWRVIALIYAIPLLPLTLLHAALVADKRIVLAALVQLALSLVAFLMGAIIAVTISDLCLGLRPSTTRSYQRGLANFGRLLGTYLMTALIIVAGFILLIVPGAVWGTWYMFTLPVVVLEQLGGKQARARSRALGKGSYWRNVGIMLAVGLPTYIAALIAARSIGMILASTFGISVEATANGANEVLSFVILAPLTSIPSILLYYDMRARKEGYAAVQLAEDLRI